MTEKEKAAQQLLYNANYDKALCSERREARMKLHRFNFLSPDKLNEKTALLRSLFRKTGENIIVESPFHCDYGYNIEIGDNFYANVNLVILDGAKVTIGNNVLIAPNVGIYTAGHPFDVAQRKQGLEYAFPIVIGDNVWIGGNVCILPGVTIGDNSIIAAGSVVTKDIPNNVLAMGNPCRVAREINSEDACKYKF